MSITGYTLKMEKENTELLDKEFVEKMKSICKKTVTNIAEYFKPVAVETHIFGSMARGDNDALSDIDIWITFDNDKIKEAIENRMASYEQFGEIVLLHEMQHNFPLDGIQTAILYKIDDELVRVDFYLCPLSSSRVVPDSKILFQEKVVEHGAIIPETKRTPRDMSDRITFFISMAFNSIKKVVRKDQKFIDFVISEIEKYEKDIPELSHVPKEASFEMVEKLLSALESVSNDEQKNAIKEINVFLAKVRSYSDK